MYVSCHARPSQWCRSCIPLISSTNTIAFQTVEIILLKCLKKSSWGLACILCFHWLHVFVLWHPHCVLKSLWISIPLINKSENIFLGYFTTHCWSFWRGSTRDCVKNSQFWVSWKWWKWRFIISLGGHYHSCRKRVWESCSFDKQCMSDPGWCYCCWPKPCK
jgi:hypothetical protein